MWLHGALHQLAACVPGAHQHKHAGTNGQWEPAPIRQFDEVGCKKAHIHDQKEQGGRSGGEQRVLPAPAHNKERQHRGDQHVQRHGNTVSRSQIARGLEKDDGQRNTGAQAPVHQWQVDLACIGFAGVQHLQARQIAQLDDLFGHAEGTRNQGL